MMIHIPNVLSPEQVARSIGETGIGFMFAPNHHGAMKHAAPVRREPFMNRSSYRCPRCQRTPIATARAV